jgi:hypothetical protein
MSDGSPTPAESPTAKPREPIFTRRYLIEKVVEICVLILIGVIYYFLFQRHPPCVYPSHYSAADAMSWLVEAEGDAVVTKDVVMLRRIFAANGQVHNRTIQGTRPTPWAEHYRQLLSETQFLLIKHHSLQDVSVDGEIGRMTSGSAMVMLSPDAGVQFYRNPEGWDRWTFSKNARGCWAISRLEFGPPPAQPAASAPEDTAAPAPADTATRGGTLP